MAYQYRFYRFASAAEFIAAWDAAGLLQSEGVPFVPGGDVHDIGPASPGGEGPPENWHVNAAWPGTAPEDLIPFEIPWAEGLPAYAGSRGSPPHGNDLNPTDLTFGDDQWQSSIA